MGLQKLLRQIMTSVLVIVFLLGGSQGTEDGQFQWPEGLVVDPQGNLYVSDPERHDIQKFGSTGLPVVEN